MPRVTTVLFVWLGVVLVCAGCDGVSPGEAPRFPVTFEAEVNEESWNATASAVEQDAAILLLADQYSDQVEDANADPARAVQNTAGDPFVRAQIRISVPGFAGEGTYDLGEGSARYVRLIGGDVLGSTATSQEGTLRITTYDPEAARLEGSVEFEGRTDQDRPFALQNGRFWAPITEGPTPIPGND